MNMQDKFSMQKNAQPRQLRGVTYKVERFGYRELMKIDNKTKELAGIESYCFSLLNLSQEPRIPVLARYKNM